MGRPKKIVEEGIDFAQDVQEMDGMEAAPKQQNNPVVESPLTPKRRGRKPNMKTSLNDLLAEFEAKKAKLVNRYLTKIHKTMGI